MNEKILIIEDDTTIRETLHEVLEKQHYNVHQAADGSRALQLIKKHNYNLILLDLRLPDMHGLDVMEKLRKLDSYALVVVMTAYPEVRTAVSALKAGAYDYINKPFELDEMKELIRRSLETQQLRTEVERLRISTAQSASIKGMIGKSPAFLEMLDIIHKVAVAGRVPVLIRGESGTGKERVAQSIHNLSKRASGPWVTLNCSAISEGLLESEMFGHEKGAFTDAKSCKRGLLELADGGTLFLDEMGDLALSLQPKLLRAIETQTFRRVGGQQEVHVDVRFVAATHRDLEAMVGNGAFRKDLYYRLNVASIDVPSLRSRHSDILALAHHFLEQAATTMGIHNAQMDPCVNKLLEVYHWPGNVRELRNVMERALILSGGAPVIPACLPKEIIAPAIPVPIVESDARNLEAFSLAEIEKCHIQRMLTANHGNKTQTAKQLGITRLTLRNKIKHYLLREFLDE